jgi:transcriptional regulator with PAS, ATPase and Fis domain
MPSVNWAKEYPGAITVCDRQGIILFMNDKAIRVLSGDGQSLVGKNVLDCHPEAARAKLAEMLATQQFNSYTIEKGGIKKLIHQTPWYENGCYMGFVELSIEIPFTMAHHVRVPKTK